MESQTQVPAAAPKKNTYRSPDCDDESLLSEASDVAVTTADIYDNQDPNAAPMHLHALRHPARLTGSGMVKQNSLEKLDQVPTPRGRRSRSTSRPRSSGRLSNNSSRSTSPVTLSSMETAGVSARDAYLDPDILTDKLGFIDLDPPLPHEIRCGPYDKSSGGLTPVNERLSEETLEDCHAFTDLGYYKSDAYSASGVSMPSVTHSCSLSGFGSNMSVGSQSLHSRDTVSVGGASVQEGSVLGLGRLDEEDDEDEGDEEREDKKKLEVVKDDGGDEEDSD
jgi:hypothetical protein